MYRRDCMYSNETVVQRDSSVIYALKYLIIVKKLNVYFFT